MRAVQYDRYGGPEVLEIRDLPVPEPGPGEVLVRVMATGVNPKDAVVRAGEFKVLSGRRFPKGTGFDFAGVVEASGANVSDLAPGQRVWGFLDGFDGGAAADYVAVPAEWVAPAPEPLSWVEAAALPLVGLTALQSLRDDARLQAGERVLIKGASGGVGSAAIQLAKAMGAEVTAVASTANIDHCRSLGADHTIDYTVQDPADLPEQFDVVLDCYGNSPLRRYRRLLTPGGRFVAAAPSPEAVLRAALSRFLPVTEVRIVGVKPRRADLEELGRYVESGALRMPVSATYQLEEIGRAHADVHPRHARGKRVVLVAAEATNDTKRSEQSITMAE